jgi:hypothetical protein
MQLSANPSHPSYHGLARYIEAVYIAQGEEIKEIEDATLVDDNYPHKGFYVTLNNDGSTLKTEAVVFLRWKMVAGDVFRPLFSDWCQRETQLGNIVPNRPRGVTFGSR